MYTTAALWTGIFLMAKNGYVMPFFKEYGAIFKTHRVFRHYFYALLFPMLYSAYNIDAKFHNHIEGCWRIHVNRLNNKMLGDPEMTYYTGERMKAERTLVVPTIFQRVDKPFTEPKKTFDDEE